VRRFLGEKEVKIREKSQKNPARCAGRFPQKIAKFFQWISPFPSKII